MSHYYYYKVATVFLLILVFCLSLSTSASAARDLVPHTHHHNHNHDHTSLTPIQTHQSVDEIEGMDMEEKCGAEDEECFMRRTLAAHLDYIYTQKHKP